MRILIACECSGIVRNAFRAKGHDAYSCDILHPTDLPDGFSEAHGSEYHIHDDVSKHLHDGWDMMIAFPPCTHLAVSGARYFAQKKADGRQGAALDFIRLLLDAPIPRIALENPIGIISSEIRKPTQIVQPWQFGEDASKATCLWLKNLPSLVPTNVLPGGKNVRRGNQTPSGQNKLGPSTFRALLRSKTYRGIADAMADQWGNLPLDNHP